MEIYNLIKEIETKETVGYEDISEILRKLDNAISNKIKNFLDFIRTTKIIVDNLHSYKTKMYNIKDLQKIKIKLLKALNKNEIVPNIVLRRKVPIILGLNKTLPELVTILSTSSKVLNQYENIVKDLEDRISKTIIKNDISLFLPNKREVSEIAKTVSEVGLVIESITDKKQMTDMVEMRKVINNITKLPEIINMLLKLGEVYRMERVETMIDRLNDVVPNVKLLIDRLLNENNNDEKIKNEIITYLKTVAEITTIVGMLELLYLQTVDMTIAIIKTVLAPIDARKLGKQKLKSVEVEQSIIQKIKSKLFSK